MAIAERVRTSARPLHTAALVTAAIPIMLAVSAFLLRLSIGPLTIDDAYITFRYARNLAEGLVVVYNPGVHVIGTTTPCWMLVLAIAYRLGFHDLPTAALVLGAAADAVTTILIIRLATRLKCGPNWAAFAGFLFAICPLSIIYTTAGMETPLFTLFVVGAMVADIEDHPNAAGVLAGLALVTRPEGIIVALLIVGRYAATRRRPPLGFFLSWAAPVVPWCLFAFFWSGHILPQSMLAKGTLQHFPPLTALYWLAEAIGRPGFSGAWLYLDGRQASLAVLMGLLFMALGVATAPLALRHLRRSPELAPLILFVPFLFGSYTVRGVLPYPWYVGPSAPFLVLAAVRLLSRRSPVFALPLAALLFAWMLLGLNLGRSTHQFLAPVDANLVRERGYAEAALFLRPQLRPHDVIAAPEIGALGYVSGARILDTYGLVSPGVVRYYTSAFRRSMRGQDAVIPPALLRHERPRYLVTEDRWLTQQKHDLWFQRHYARIYWIPAPVPAWRSGGISIYRRIA